LTESEAEHSFEESAGEEEEEEEDPCDHLKEDP
jgi:hypothetical protein